MRKALPVLGPLAQGLPGVKVKGTPEKVKAFCYSELNAKEYNLQYFDYPQYWLHLPACPLECRAFYGTLDGTSTSSPNSRMRNAMEV